MKQNRASERSFERKEHRRDVSMDERSVRTLRLSRPKKKGEREKEEASHARVITNAAGIHDPRHLAPSSNHDRRVAFLLFSVRRTPPRIVCTRAKRGPTTKRRTQNVPSATFRFHGRYIPSNVRGNSEAYR